MNASAVPHFRNGGPAAVAQTLGGRGRQSRGRAATMVDITAGQGTAGKSGLPSLGEIGDILKRGDIALAVGVLTILVVLILNRRVPALLIEPLPRTPTDPLIA